MVIVVLVNKLDFGQKPTVIFLARLVETDDESVTRGWGPRVISY